MGNGELNADWGFGETLAYASLLEDGYAVRLIWPGLCARNFFSSSCGFP